MDWDWVALGSALRARRRVLRLTQEEAAKQAGVSTASIKNYEQGRKTYERIPRSVIAYAETLGWAPGAVQTVLAGGEPILAEPPTVAAGVPDRQAAPLAALAARLPASTIHELENGELFATDTYDLTLDGGLRLFTVVIRSPDQEPRSLEQVKAETEAWHRTQRQLRQQSPVDTGTSSVSESGDG